MLKEVNKKTVKLYWNIGKTISIKTNQNKWGKAVVEKLGILFDNSETDEIIG